MIVCTNLKVSKKESKVIASGLNKELSKYATEKKKIKWTNQACENFC